MMWSFKDSIKCKDNITMGNNTRILDIYKYKYTILLTISSLIGLILSVYTFNVETKAERDQSYRAMCDISEKISCTKVFTSKYGKGFGLVGYLLGETSVINQPNGLIGVIFYTLVALLNYVNHPRAAQLQIFLYTISSLMSVYLAYLLYFVLDDFCVVCVTTYAINFISFILSLKRYKSILVNLEQFTDSSKLD